MRIITALDIAQIVKTVGIKDFFLDLIDQLKKDFSRWNEFIKAPRPAFHYPHGVIELMPISDKEFFSFKYVNGHPNNPAKNKMTVVATGQLSDVETGYPILFSEMTLLTAFRTAATAALSSHYLAKKNAKSLAIIGTGSQAEFLVLAHYFALGIKSIHYFDIDAQAMRKFSENLADFPLELKIFSSAKEAVEGVDIIITATADKNRLSIIEKSWLKSGMHIAGIGGDCPGKTELDPAILKSAKIVVEFYEQSKMEGEIQNLEAQEIYAELWELCSGLKPGRENDSEITLFDSVGFALEDYSVLKLIHRLSEEMNAGECVNILPEVKDPKNLFEVLKR